MQSLGYLGLQDLQQKIPKAVQGCFLCADLLLFDDYSDQLALK